MSAAKKTKEDKRKQKKIADGASSSLNLSNPHLTFPPSGHRRHDKWPKLINYLALTGSRKMEDEIRVRYDNQSLSNIEESI